MASKFKATVVSNEYINAVADSAATGKPIAYSGVVASSTVFTDEQLKTLDYTGAQSANKEVTSAVTSSYLKQGSNTIVIEVNLSNENLSTDFQWASVLIYATYNGNNILVAVLRLVTPELFQAYDGKSIVSVGVDLFISVDKTAAANISVNGAGYATMDTVNKLRNYVDNDFNTTIIRSDKDGVLNGSYSFSKAINALDGINGSLNTRVSTFTDFADVAKNMVKYAGNWYTSGKTIANSPISTSYATIQIVNGDGSGNGYIFFSTWSIGKTYIGYVNNYLISKWSLIAQDETVLHKTGDESADGIKTFIKQIIAQSGVKGNLQGNAETATKLATARKLGGVSFDGTGDVTLPGVNTTGNQNTTGNAATATTAAGSDKLNTGRNISVTGDVTAPAQKFDGTKDVALIASLPAITRSDTSSNSSVGYGGTITVIDSVITDSKGRITGLNVSKIAIPNQQTTITGNAGTATKLQTSRKIGGVSFDGTQDIDLAGVNKIGNQDTTGKAASADVLNTRLATFTDFADVAKNMFKYSGNWQISGNLPISNGPYGTTSRISYVTVNNAGLNDAGLITFVDLPQPKEYYIGVVAAGNIVWKKLSDDSTVVHNVGSENVSGAKNFFDVLTALSGIKGDVTGSLKGNADTSTKLSTSRKINGVGFDGTSDITVNPVTRVSNSAVDVFSLTNGFYYVVGSTRSTNIPANASPFFTVEVIQTTTNGFMRLIDSNGSSFWTTKSSSTWGAWHQDADDATVMHLSGDETAAGFKKFSGNISTTSDNSMINGGGNNGDIAFVKKNGNQGFLAVGTSNTTLRIKTSNNTAISPSDTFTDMFTVDKFGIVKAGTQQDLVPLDKNVVHNSGNETISGSKTFSSTINGNLNGNSTTSTKLQTARTIGGVSFDGTANINLPGVNTAGNQNTSGKAATAGRADTAAKADSATTANDPNALHQSGNESASGTKTFTGTLVANNPITGVLSIANLSQKDLNSATVNGRYKIDTTYSNIPTMMPNGAFLDVMNFDGSLIYQVIVARDFSDTTHKSTMWIRMKFANNWGDWEGIAKDVYVVHNIADETISGTKTFTSTPKLTSNSISQTYTKTVGGMTFNLNRVGNMVMANLYGKPDNKTQFGGTVVTFNDGDIPNGYRIPFNVGVNIYGVGDLQLSPAVIRIEKHPNDNTLKLVWRTQQSVQDYINMSFTWSTIDDDPNS